MSRLHLILVASTLLGGVATADANAKLKLPVTRVTRQSIEQHFGGAATFKKMAALAQQRQWKPTQMWLGTEGKKYGTLLVVSDTHPGPGVDPTTGKTSPAEDFMGDRQEVDFRDMLKAERLEAKQDGKRRTLVLNGDTLEFMQTTTAAEGHHFKGKADQFGPLNTPRTIRTKLDAIREGHPGMFEAYAEHLLEGHRIVLLPGNHDRQLQHPAVRARLRKILVNDMTAKLTQDQSFAPGATGAARKVAAIQKARSIAKDQFEFMPHFFLHGDVFAQHGHQNDPFNSFSTLLGSYYARPMTRDVPMESAMGDYIVKGLFNEMEARVPWGDNSKISAAFKGVYKQKGAVFAANWLITKLPMKYRYILTREGHFGPEAQKIAAAKERAELGRMVGEFKLVDKLNELREGKPPLDQKQVVDALVEYQSLQAKPVLSYFNANHGMVRRLLTAAANAKTFLREFPEAERLRREERSIAFLFNRFDIKTHLTGHDHEFRDERYIVGKGGNERLGRTIDTATWTDAMAGEGRDAMSTKLDRRGVGKITFDEHGSRSRLMQWDRQLGKLTEPAVLPGADEALGDVRAANAKKR